MSKNKKNKNKKNYTKWVHNSSNILSIAAIVISILSLSISIIQTRLQNNAIRSQKKENQPIFQVNYKLAKLNNDSIYDTEIMNLKNVGKEASDIVYVRYPTFINLHVSGPQKSFRRKDEIVIHFNEQDIYIPIEGYFHKREKNFLLSGDLFSDSIIGNYLMYQKFEKECEENSNDSIEYTCYLDRFVNIGYYDIYDEYHTTYLEKGNLWNSEYYEYVSNKARILFNYHTFDINTKKFDSIKEYIKIDSIYEHTKKYPESIFDPYALRNR